MLSNSIELMSLNVAVHSSNASRNFVVSTSYASRCSLLKTKFSGGQFEHEKTERNQAFRELSGTDKQHLMTSVLNSIFSILFGSLIVLALSLFSPLSLAEDEQDSSSGAVIFTDSERVVMGGKALIGRHEKVEKLVVIGGTAEVYGSVRELVLVGGYLNLREGAIILEDLVVVGGFVEREEGVEILGKQVDITLPVSEDGWRELTRNLKARYLDNFLQENRWIPYTTATLKVLALLVLALVGQMLTPGLMQKTREYLSSYKLYSGFLGLATTLLVLPVTMFLVLSLVGIPLLPLQFSLLIIFVIFGEIHVASVIGGYLVGRRTEFSMLGIALGLVALQLIGFIPFMGWVKWLLVLAGFGATARVFNKQLLSKLNT